MSEYQYYEFQSIDRRLDEKEMQLLRGYSSRAEITPTSFQNEYSYGDFKGNANLWMEKYFDAYLYLANWGTHELQLRVSSSVLPLKVARQYCAGESATVREKSGHLVFTFLAQDESGGGWIEGDGLLSSILPVRDGLIRGDLRTLYLGWLLCALQGDLDDDAVEPPVPPNLGELTGSLSNLADFLRIDSDLLEVAAEVSPTRKLTPTDSAAMRSWVTSLPSKEKDDLLVRLMEGKEAHLGTDLLARYRRHAEPTIVAKQGRRTVGELLAASQARAESRRLEGERKSAQAKAERERLAAIAREKHLDVIAQRVPQLWREVEDLVATLKPKSYDLAVQHLVDLRDVARREGNEADFTSRLAALQKTHSNKTSFLTRLNQQEM
jgi:hypothetical protein